MKQFKLFGLLISFYITWIPKSIAQKKDYDWYCCINLIPTITIELNKCFKQIIFHWLIFAFSIEK